VRGINWPFDFAVENHPSEYKGRVKWPIDTLVALANLRIHFKRQPLGSGEFVKI